MTVTAKGLLAAFENLEPADRQEVAAEILRRTAGAGEIPDSAFEQLADELFVSYDAEEESHANGETR